MKSHQNRLDRFTVIAKKLVDEHAAELHRDVKVSTHDSVYKSHLTALGKQLNDYALEFIKSCKVKNEHFINEVWGTCNKYLDLFAKYNEPSESNSNYY